MFKILFWAVILILVLRFITRFILPLLQITSMTQTRLRDIQKQMEELKKKKDTSSAPKKKVGDYIEFEEVR